LAEASLQFDNTEVMDGLLDWYKKRTGSSLARGTLRGYLQSLENDGYEVVRPYCANKRKEQDEIEPPEHLTKEQLFDRAWDEYRALIGMSAKHKSPKSIKSKDGRRRKICVISDTHGKPHADGIVSIIAERPGVVLVVGDVFDLLAVSKFPHMENIPIEAEMASVRAMLEQLSSVATVKLVSGNHDIRLFKWFCQKVGSEYLRFVHTDILGMSVANLPNCQVVKNNHTFHLANGKTLIDTMNDEFMVTEGDAVFMHAEVARKGGGNTARYLANEWYPMWQGVLGMPNVRVLGQAHVHSANTEYSRGGHLICLELGCMVHPSVLNYQLAGNVGYRAPTIGYYTLEQTKKNSEWFTEPNSVRFTLC
jgi:predicted phosphodiesterase